MTVSNTASALRPGVCLSTTRPSAPYTGQTIFETDTNRLLVWNGSSWVIPNQTTTNPTGLEFIKFDTITSGTSKEITGAFSSSYANYRIVIGNIQTSGVDNINFRFGTTAAGYYGSQYYDSYGGTTGVNRQNAGAQLNIGYGENFSGGGLISFDVLEPNSTNNRKLITGTYYGAGYAGWFGGMIVNATAYTSFTIYTQGSSTFTSCNIRIYGYRNS